MAKKLRVIDLSEIFPEDSDPRVEISSEEVATVVTYEPPQFLTMSVQDVVCQSCGAVYRHLLGMFQEYRKVANDRETRRLVRVPDDTDPAGFSYLPRRIDYAPPARVRQCPTCWYAGALISAAEAPMTVQQPADHLEISI